MRQAHQKSDQSHTSVAVDVLKEHTEHTSMPLFLAV